MVNYAISNISTSGKVYIQNHASLTFTDDGVTYTARIQTANTNEETDNLKFYHDLNIEADTESSASDLAIAVADDDFATYQTLGTVDLSGLRPLKITRLGAARQRAWALIHSANTPMRIHRAQGNLTIGSS
jgi:ABC-type transport system involved in cytochrome c biogenesis ATPase subunit